MLTLRQRQKGAGGGAARGPPRGHHRDYDSPGYGQPSNSSSGPPQTMPASSAAPAAGAGGQADPYAMCRCPLRCP